MKKILAWPVAWLFYYMGDGISRTWIGDTGPGWRAYQWFMSSSVSVQDWAGLKDPWHKPEDV